MAGLKVISGPMCSGKTGRLIEELESNSYAAFRPVNGDRDVYAGKVLATRDGDFLPSTPVSPDMEGVDELVESVLEEDPESVGIDEAHFFGSEILGAAEYMASLGYDVVAAGLDRDFRGERFPSTHYLQMAADEVVELTAECTDCGEEAPFTQRLVDGEPAPYEAPQVKSEVDVRYEPRCSDDHELNLKTDNLSF